MKQKHGHMMVVMSGANDGFSAAFASDRVVTNAPGLGCKPSACITKQDSGVIVLQLA